MRKNTIYTLLCVFHPMSSHTILHSLSNTNVPTTCRSLLPHTHTHHMYMHTHTTFNKCSLNTFVATTILLLWKLCCFMVKNHFCSPLEYTSNIQQNTTKQVSYHTLTHAHVCVMHRCAGTTTTPTLVVQQPTNPLSKSPLLSTSRCCHEQKERQTANVLGQTANVSGQIANVSGQKHNKESIFNC